LKPLAAVRWVVAVMTLAVLAWSGPVAAGDSKDLAEPRAAFEHFIAVFNALDWKSFQATFADDASVFNPDIPEVISLHRLDGRSEFERTFRAVFDSKLGPHIVPENVRVQRFGDTAIVTFEFERTTGSFGRRTVVLNHRRRGWLIVHIHASNVTRAPNQRLEPP
jgi:ketosteroid isomerase-like protein